VAPGELHLLSAGSPGDGPSSAEQLSHFLEVARARYEVVLVDVPGHVPTNAMACISATDHILLVVGLGHTRRRLLDELLGNLPHARTLGLVVDPRPRAARKTASAPAPLGREGPLVSV
jgi:cellulose biosynthesis protein BcsQ